MHNRILLPVLVICLWTTAGLTQNFSGLLNKKLNKIEDLATTLESLLGRIGGSIDGNIDSVVVTGDWEKELKVKVYYTGFENGFFTVSTMSVNRTSEPAISVDKFNHPTRSSPAECTLLFNGKYADNPAFESVYLRVDISRKENRSGKVKVYELRKKWLTNTPLGESAVTPVLLQPVGIAATLPSTPGDVLPTKKIVFDPKDTYKKPTRTIKSSRIGAGNSYLRPFRFNWDFVDISGTWTNSITPPNEQLSKFVITGNSSIQVFKKCPSGDCPIGTYSFGPPGAPAYSIKTSNAFIKTELLLTSITAAQMNVRYTVQRGKALNKSEYNYVFKKKQFKQPQAYTLGDWQATLLGGSTSTPPSTAELGPQYSPIINLWNQILVDPLVEFQRPQEISNINVTIHPDKNIYSGVYYMLPADYHVRWTENAIPSKGYDFRILYGEQEMSGESDPEAPVRITATLTADITMRERNMVTAILKLLDPKFKELKFLPLSEVPKSTFPEMLTAQFGVPADKITVSTSTDLSNDIKISMRTTAYTKELIQTSLTSREGLTAAVLLKPKNEEIDLVQIPATINLADNRTLGKMHIDRANWRTQMWKNNTPYPLQLRYLHVMRKTTTGNNMVIYSWSMNDVIVPRNGQISFDHSRVPAWLDTDPTAIMWIDYGVSDCTECDSDVLLAVTDGVFGNTLQQIKFTIAPAVFDSLNADYFLITIRSKQADPKNEIVKELSSLRIPKDPTKDYIAGPLYLPQGVSPDFEYLITVATRDGDFYKAAQWSKGTDKEILLGRKEMKELFRGIIPGIN